MFNEKIIVANSDFLRKIIFSEIESIRNGNMEFNPDAIRDIIKLCYPSDANINV